MTTLNGAPTALPGLLFVWSVSSLPGHASPSTPRPSVLAHALIPQLLLCLPDSVRRLHEAVLELLRRAVLLQHGPLLLGVKKRDAAAKRDRHRGYDDAPDQTRGQEGPDRRATVHVRVLRASVGRDGCEHLCRGARHHPHLLRQRCRHVNFGRLAAQHDHWRVSIWPGLRPFNHKTTHGLERLSAHNQSADRSHESSKTKILALWDRGILLVQPIDGPIGFRNESIGASGNEY
mmetsp:Transcript_8094/g.20169  ORF Transcript_8094/g.20169 Transcript_8094/m.20169 type:complete len:233 (+) Transcript_8094:126-824(+)